MPRVDDSSDELPGGDSFLDVVANIVGILVLLVVVVGVRAGQHVAEVVGAPADAVEVEPLESIAERTRAVARQAQLDHGEVRELQEQVAAVVDEAVRRDELREAETWYVTKLRAELDEARGDLSENDQRSLETHNAIAQAQLKLERLAREQIGLSAIEPERDVETVTVAPTPIVDGRADKTVSFRLQGGRLVYVPVDEVINELTQNLQPPPFSDPSAQVVTKHSVGPVQGFNARAIVAWRALLRGNRVGVQRQLVGMQLEEVTALQGEPLDQAFSVGGYVASRLELLDPETYVVRLMIYPDSFDAAPEAEQGFREKGYRIAKSLQAEGEPIGFSSNGYRAVTQ